MVILCCISMLVKFISNLPSLHCIIITQTLNVLLVNLDMWIQENMKISVDVNYKQFITVKPVLLTNCGICFTMYISLIIWFISLLHCLTKHPVSLNKIYLPMPVFCHLHLVWFFWQANQNQLCREQRGDMVALMWKLGRKWMQLR